MSTTGCWAVVPAGGAGLRFRQNNPMAPDKLLAIINGTAVLRRTVKALMIAESVAGVVVAASDQSAEKYQRVLQNLPKPLRFVPGGADRRASVYSGLIGLPEDVCWVLIHDAARPLIRPSLIDQAIQEAQRLQEGIVIGLPLTDTVKQVQATEGAQFLPVIENTLNRQQVWSVQTPQIFLRETLMAAHLQAPQDVLVTDDAQLVELAGRGTVRMMQGDPDNLKITTPHDIRLAEWYLQSKPLRS